MAIAFDSASSSNNFSGSFNHTCGTGANLLVYFINRTASVTATYNGVSMTNFGTYNSQQIFYLIDPPIGTYSIAPSGGGNGHVAISFSGVDTTNLFPAIHTEVSLGDSIGTKSCAVTTTENDSVVFGTYICQNGTSTYTAGTDTTLRGTESIISSNQQTGLMTSSSSIATPSSFTLNIEKADTGGTNTRMTAIELVAAASTATNSNFLALL